MWSNLNKNLEEVKKEVETLQDTVIEQAAKLRELNMECEQFKDRNKRLSIDNSRLLDKIRQMEKDKDCMLRSMTGTTSDWPMCMGHRVHPDVGYFIRNMTDGHERRMTDICRLRDENSRLRTENKNLREAIAERIATEETKNTKLKIENERLKRMDPKELCDYECGIRASIRKSVLAELREKLKGHWIFIPNPAAQTGNYGIDESVLLKILNELGA